MLLNSPEPMNLGSPSQSPPSSSINQYIPQFLLGDLNSSNQNINRNQQQTSKYWTQSNSPPRVNLLSNSNSYNHILQNGGITSSISRNYSANSFDLKLNNSNLIERNEQNQLNHYGSYQQHSTSSNFSPLHERTLGSTSIMSGNIINSHGEKSLLTPGAPPVNRLIDMINKPNINSSSSLLIPNETTKNKLNNENFNATEKNDHSFTPNSNLNQNRLSPASPTQIDPFYTYGESIKMDEKLDETWITVFGFPQSATSFVLQEFSIYGQIIRHIPNVQGNWMHIQYHTKLQAQKALSKNGKVLANSLMVGVMPCIDKKIMNLEESSKIDGSKNLQSNFKSKTNKIFLTGSKLDRTQSLRTNVRPLGTFNGSKENNLSATDYIQDLNLPKKNVNVISKAMEYMFGW